jgi:hypothetical protein
MTSSPNFTDPQFLDAVGVGGLNSAFGTVSGSIAAAGSGMWAIPGLLSPEAMTVSFSGMVATVGLPPPWALVSSSGAVVHAHGTQTGQDTHTYTANFASLVPATGTQIAFLAATIVEIQQNPFPIPGPPQGDPAYNPNFVPIVGYATNQYSVALSVVTGVPDNINTFTLFQTTLVPSQTVVSGWTENNQQRASAWKSIPRASLISGGNLTPQQAQTMLSFTVSGLTSTLPPSNTAKGLTFNFLNESGNNCTIACAGSDLIYGFSGGGGVSTVTIPQAGFVSVWDSGTYYLITATNMSLYEPLGGVLTGNLPNPGMAAGAAATNIGALGGVLGGTLPNPTMAAGAAATNVGSLGGVLGGTLPNPTMAAGAAATNVGSLGGVLGGTLPNPTMAAGAASLNYSQRGSQAYGAPGATTFVVPASVYWIMSRVWGGGGGGGGAANVNGAGGGGGGGGYSEGLYNVTPGSSISILVGAGGAGGFGASNGSPGSGSAFGSVCTASAGGGGAYGDGFGGIGGGSGNGFGGTVTFQGYDGGPGGPTGAGGSGGVGGGFGGASFCGWSQPGGTGADLTGPSSPFPGVGGGGSVTITAGHTGTGGAGANGLVLLYW